MQTIEISGVLGMIAAVILTLNISMGILISIGYKKLPLWKRLPARYKNIRILDVHNYSSYFILILVFIHILILPLDPSSGFKYNDLLFPIHVKHQPFFVLLGYFSLIALIIVLLTTQKVVKKLMGYQIWKYIHFISFGTALLFFIHALVMDPILKDRPIDFFDAEKVIIELCGLFILCMFYVRYKFRNINSNLHPTHDKY